MSSDEPLRDTCYTVISTPYDYSQSQDKEYFTFQCPDGSLTDATNDFMCYTESQVNKVFNWTCPSTVTTETGIVYDNIETVDGIPNVCEEGGDLCLDSDTGVPINGWLVQPTCVVMIPTSFDDCNGVLTETF